MAQVRWWTNYGPFEADESGLYPQARQVVIHFRQLTGLTREQFASRLGISEKALYYAEKEGRGLDSIARLRKVARLLEIPPALLGLCEVPGDRIWWAHDYESWPAGFDGWPNTGAVIKWYRRSKSWTQVQLAEALGITELAVRNMENTCSSLDSLSRRRALHFLLAIPPILLGLDGTHAPHSHSTSTVLTRSLPTYPSLDEIWQAQNKLWTGYYTGHGQDHLTEIRTFLPQLKEALANTPESERAAYYEQLSLLYQGAGNVALATANVSVLKYQNLGVKYAKLSGNVDLHSTALGRRAAAQLELGDYIAAEKSIREALFIAPDNEKRFRYPVATRILSVLAEDEDDRREVYEMLAQIVPNERYQTGLDANIILWCRSQCLINLAQNAPTPSRLLREARELLDHAEQTAPDMPRRKLIIKLAQARAYLGLREYDLATSFAIEAFLLMRQLKSVLYLPHLSKIYRMLLMSTYAASPLVARFGLLLFQVGAL